MYNFDEAVNRKSVHSIKWTEQAPGNILGMSLADMDFVSPKEISQALKERVSIESFGYTSIDEEFYSVFIDWMKKRFSYDINREHILVTSCVVASLGVALCSYASNDDGVLIMPPVYPPFLGIPKAQGLNVVKAHLLRDEKENTYKINFDLLEEKAKEAKIFILCSPHNPIGRVWTKEELNKIADIVIKNDLILLSDEIHSDLIMPNNIHTPTANVSEMLNDRLVSIYAPNKTFNIAGIPTAYNIIPNKELRDKFANTLVGLGAMYQNFASTLAAKTAYKYGESWLNEVINYIYENYLFLCDYLKNNLNKVHVSKLEGTYLAWLDFRQLGLSDEELQKFLLEKAEVNLKAGSDFCGEMGKCFMRFNIATQRSVLKEALDRIKKAVDTL